MIYERFGLVQYLVGTRFGAGFSVWFGTWFVGYGSREGSATAERRGTLGITAAERRSTLGAWWVCMRGIRGSG